MADSKPAEKLDLERYQELIGELGLTEVQQRELAWTVNHVLADMHHLSITKIGRTERKARVQKLRDVHKAIADLLETLGATPERNNEVNECLPFAAREAISMGASPALIGQVTGRPRETLQHADLVSAIGVLSGVAILAEQLRQIKAPLDDWIGDFVPDKGGPKADLIRHYLIAQLAANAEAIIGQRATTTAHGRFARLVAGVFQVCGISDDGLEKLIERVLKSLKAGSDQVAP